MMKAFIVAALLAIVTMGKRSKYQGHYEDKKNENLLIWLNENQREMMRGVVFGLENGRTKKPS